MVQCIFCNKNHNNKSFCSLNCWYEHKRKKTINQDFFDKIDSEEKAYWLGFIYADGNLSKKEIKQKYLQIELSQKDLKHLEKFANIFNSKVHCYEQKKSCKVTIFSKKIWKDIQKYNIFPNKTYINNLILINIPDNLKKHFIRGFFDGDGNFSNDQKIISFNSNNFKILQEINKYFNEIIGTSKVKIIQRKNINILSFAGKHQTNAIKEELYKNATIFLERKKAKNIHVEKKIRGVYKTKYGSWYATIFNKGKSIYLGTFGSKEEAALAYDNAVVKYKKSLYKMNFPDSDRVVDIV